MLSRAIITSCSNKFFPSVINLLGSIKANYPNHPPIYVYDLGLFYTFRKELEMIEGVTVIEMPHFCPHWRACYTWKTYIFAHPLADINFYLDAGCQILQSLDPDFDIIERNDLLLININCRFDELVPLEYRLIFQVGDKFNDLPTAHAGIIGFKKNSPNQAMFSEIYHAGIAGLALGFSPNNSWRNKGKDKNIFVRNCLLFRHDQTLLNLFLRINFGESLPFQSIDSYSGERSESPQHRVFHIRLTWKFLEYTNILLLHKSYSLIFGINRFVIYIFSLLRQLNLGTKRLLGRL